MQIARILRILVLLELLCAAGLATWLGADAGWSWAAAVPAGLAAPLLVHAGVVGLNFGVASLAGSPTPEAQRLSLAGAASTYFREVADSIRTFQFALPWRHPAPLAGAGPSSSEVPVLLVHGYFCNRQIWRPFAAWLAERGHAVEALDLDPAFCSIDDYVPQLSEAVRRLRERTGAHRVALIGHSMGGLVARAWIRSTGGDLAARVVTIGTPHRGTFHARLGLGEGTRQMRMDSAWLQALDASEDAELRSRFTVLLSHHDNIVAPQSIQTLAGARTIEFSGIGHLSLAYDRRVWAAVDEALAWAD
ncbi:alpha/beta fold hydrolase [Quisquiliibacterium transsilvanicum]|uniref:Pimeloyl-ACP methyl ester carboxylesterase n=1 Tax=Quisquiliibacterium transsilvanicum TaxID=1549638 RepID=A0A7W8HFF7_9BURK|nr:alpha/beta fold hydrolase [Quisquiliibacterium transsilvanicum]MBB5271010.1 pimeloyl-ACP methyl ester carboxylesterase [Quisquiliibacterium transsilvanicum]